MSASYTYPMSAPHVYPLFNRPHSDIHIDVDNDLMLSPSSADVPHGLPPPAHSPSPDVVDLTDKSWSVTPDSVSAPAKLGYFTRQSRRHRNAKGAEIRQVRAICHHCEHIVNSESKSSWESHLRQHHNTGADAPYKRYIAGMHSDVTLAPSSLSHSLSSASPSPSLSHPYHTFTSPMSTSTSFHFADINIDFVRRFVFDYINV